MDAESFFVGVSLAELFEERRFFRADDIFTSACCSEYQYCRPGDIYVALMEAERDGHEDAELAIQRGAAALLTERLLPLQIPQCIVPNTREALAMLCQRLAGSPADRTSVHGVAGEWGLATTRTLACKLLEAAGRKSAWFGQDGYTDGFDFSRRTGLHGTAAQFAQWLAESDAHACGHAVTEMAHRDVVDRVCSGVPLRTLVLTGFEANTHRNTATPRIEAYLNNVVKQVAVDGLVVANLDCPIVRSWVETTDLPVLTVSLSQPATLTATLVEQFPSEQTFLLDADNETAVVRTKLIGDGHMRSCLLAAAFGLGLGLDLTSIVGAIDSVESIPGALERVDCGQSFSLFADLARTPLDLKRALLTLRSVTQGKLICVFGEGQDASLRFQRGKVAERFADLGVITSDNPRDREPLRAAHDVLDGYAKPSSSHVLPNRIRAIEWAMSQASPEDTVLLAGPTGHQLAADETGYPSDTDIAKSWVRDLDSSDAEAIRLMLPR